MPTIALVLLLRTFVVQSFWTTTDAAAPELPRGSLVLVWKSSGTIGSGDLIAYRYKGRVQVGRIVESRAGTTLVSRNGTEPSAIPPAQIIGRVISVLWRGKSGDAAITPRPPADVRLTGQEMTPEALEIERLRNVEQGKLHRLEANGKTDDGRDVSMVFDELRRDEKTSTVRVKSVGGGSVGSSMFVVQGAWGIAKARGTAFFINLKEWEGEDGTWMYLLGFAPDDRVEPVKFFGLKEPLPADKAKFFSVAACDHLFIPRK